MGTSSAVPAVLLLAAATLACASPRGAGAGSAAAPLRLAAADGKVTELAALAAAREATVLVFWSASCPCVRRYQQRADALLDAYPASRVAVYGVASNAGERFEDVLRVAGERKVRVPLLRDEGGEVARALGVQSTPTVVVLDAAGKLRFRGWIDNERLPGDPGREPWLERAVQGVLDGRTPFAARTPVYGCTITRALFGPAPGASCGLH